MEQQPIKYHVTLTGPTGQREGRVELAMIVPRTDQGEVLWYCPQYLFMDLDAEEVRASDSEAPRHDHEIPYVRVVAISLPASLLNEPINAVRHRAVLFQRQS